MGTTSLPKRLKENNQQGTIETSGSKWEVLTSVIDVYAPGRTTWCTILGE